MKKCLIILLLIPAAFLFSETRIMFLGNSITKGSFSTSELGFRKIIYDTLTAIGYDFTMVGSSGAVPYNGHFIPGARIEAFYSGPGGTATYDVASDMDTYQPHVVFLHTGTNDLISEDHIAPFRQPGETEFDPETIGGRMAYLLAYLLQWKYGARGTFLRSILVCRIIPRVDIDPYKAVAFNYELSYLVAESDRNHISQIPSGSLVYVNQYDGFDSSTMLLPDGVHPNDLGYFTMAQKYLSYYRNARLLFKIISGNNQQDRPGNMLPIPLKVRLQNGWRVGVQGVDLTFQVTSGDVTLSQNPVSTDQYGYAECPVQLNGECTSTVTVSYGDYINKTLTFNMTAASTVGVSGHVTYQTNSAPVEGAQLTQISSSQTWDTTETDGAYFLPGIEYGDNVVVRPIRSSGMDAARSTIRSYDAALCARHIVGLETLSEWQRTVADVNQDDALNMIDVFQIGRFAAGFAPETGSKLGQWAFTPDSIQLTSVNSNVDGQSFSCFLYGDVHGGYNAGLPKSSDAMPWSVTVQPQDSDGSQVRVCMQITGAPFLALDATCTFNPSALSFVSVQSDESMAGFTSNINTEQSGQIKYGLYNAKPSERDTSTIWFIFDRNTLQSDKIEFNDIVINASCVGAKQVSVQDHQQTVIPTSMGLYNNFPNPFNASTVIPFELSDASHVELTIIDIQGKVVRNLLSENKGAGQYRISWDGEDDFGNRVSSGVYLAIFQAGSYQKMIKMQVIQ